MFLWPIVLHRLAASLLGCEWLSVCMSYKDDVSLLDVFESGRTVGVMGADVLWESAILLACFR